MLSRLKQNFTQFFSYPSDIALDEKNPKLVPHFAKNAKWISSSKALLMIITLLYIRSRNLIILQLEVRTLWPTSSHFSTLPLAITILLSVSVSSVFMLFSRSVAQSWPTLWDPMDCSTPAFPVLHHLPELAQTHVHRVGDAIQPSHPLSSPYPPPAFNLSQHQGLFQWVSSLHQVAKILKLQLQHQSFQWIFRVDFFYDWLVWFPCSPRDSQESSLAPQFKSINFLTLSLFHGPTLTSIQDYWKNHSFHHTNRPWSAK